MKTIVGIFAHPDDETFGPGGTIAQFAKENNVYLICVTNGDWNVDHLDPELGVLRKKELQAAANKLGVKEVIFLEFHDGTLCNNCYHTVANKITEQLEKLHPDLLITLEPRGVSGHLDHIAVSMITSYVFIRLSFIQELWYFCISDAFDQFVQDYFIYFPPGYNKTAIDKVVSVSDVWSQKIAAMHEHQSQKKDIDTISKALSRIPKEEYFLIKKRK